MSPDLGHNGHLEDLVAGYIDRLLELYDAANETEKDVTAAWIAVVCQSLRDHDSGLARAEKLKASHVKERLRAFYLLRSSCKLSVSPKILS